MTDSIRTVGPARFNSHGVEVLAFHLHRYLAHWLDKTDRERVWVTVGFEHGLVPGITVEVCRTSSRGADVAWTFDDLCRAYHVGASRPVVEVDASKNLEAIPLTEESHDGARAVCAFVVLPDATDLDEVSLAELEVHTGEGIRASRRNGVRLFFDECDERDMKALLYAALDNLPAWAGCDVAAAVVLSSTLDARSLAAAHRTRFSVMAERLFTDADDPERPRLVGMQLETGGDVRTVIDAAIARQQREPSRRAHRFRRTTDGYVDEDGEVSVSIGRVDGRPDDATSVVAPLIVGDDDDDELLGFLCLAFTGTAPIPRSVDGLVADLAERLAHVLRFSPLYTLSASKLRLVRSIRRACESWIAREGDAETRRDGVIAETVRLIGEMTDVPAATIGWLDLREGRRHLVFPTSYGWTDFESIDLLVDVPADKHVDSGVSALAVRLARPITLAGGRHGDSREFKNFLWVNESTRSIVDARAPLPTPPAPRDGWERLGEYYKPARAGAYATVAYPITFDGRPLGVVAIEVDRDTNWTWWTGYGGELLWDLIASELAFAFRFLDVTDSPSAADRDLP